MCDILKTLLKEDTGQNMIEYALLLAFLTLASAALFLGSSDSIYGIWLITNSNLSTARQAAS